MVSVSNHEVGNADFDVTYLFDKLTMRVIASSRGPKRPA